MSDLANHTPAVPHKASSPTPLPEFSGGTSGWLQLGLTPQLEWNCFDLPVNDLPLSMHGWRIIHLTDMHLTPRWSVGYDQFLHKIKADPPELILISGDYVDHKLDHRKSLPTVERFLTQLAAKHGIFGVMGNHDGDLLEPRLGQWGVQIIQHVFMRLQAGSERIDLIGLPGVKRRDIDPNFIERIPARIVGVPRIIIGHYPDQVRFVGSLQSDAMLVGHTHGGQIRMPNGYPPLTHDQLPKNMASGVHQFGPTSLFVSRGFGTTKWPIRIFCPAEVIELRLRG